MINSKAELKEYITADSKANGRKSSRPKLLGDEVWKFQIVLRKLEYYEDRVSKKKILDYIPYAIYKMKFHKYSVRLGFSIPTNVFDKGMSIPHYGTIVVSKYAEIGKNCRIHENVTIGATNGSKLAAQIGNNVFIGSGAKIIGNIKIADNVAIAANAVVVKDILEAGTTWGGNPAIKVSCNDSRSNLNVTL